MNLIWEWEIIIAVHQVLVPQDIIASSRFTNGMELSSWIYKLSLVMVLTAFKHSRLDRDSFWRSQAIITDMYGLWILPFMSGIQVLINLSSFRVLLAQQQCTLKI